MSKDKINQQHAFYQELVALGFEERFNNFILNERAHNQKYWAEKLQKAVFSHKYADKAMVNVEKVIKDMIDESKKYLND